METIGNETALQKRNYAMTILAAQTGMRRSDIIGLKFESIDWERDTITFVQQKTGSETSVHLALETGEAIRDYITNARPQSASNNVFVSYHPPYAALTPSAFTQIISLAFAESGININGRKTGPHALRHSRASFLLSQGASLKFVADELGHKNVQTTTLYAKIDTPNLEKCALSVPPYRVANNYPIDERLEFPVVGLLACHIVDFILYKRAMGRKGDKEFGHLRNLAKFSLDYDLSASLLPQAMVEDWIIRRGEEKSNSQASRVHILRQFGSFLRSLGFDVFVPEAAPGSAWNTRFAPHIFSDDELRRFFEIADTLPVGIFRIAAKRKLLIPTLFRLLLGCGLRISEALNLKIADVDLNAGTLRILNAKYNKDRLVLIDHTLREAMRRYFSENKDLASSSEYVFAGEDGSRLKDSTVYQWFREILSQAKIPHHGRGCGPRVHDFRHTFAVRSLNQMLKEGKSLYNALPILKEYLGHYDIEATERYVRLVEWMFPEIITAMNSISEQIIPQLEVVL